MQNLTTNEQFNVQKYNYFWITDPKEPGLRRFRNPWFKGRWKNFCERIFFPTPASYLLPEEYQGLLLRQQERQRQQQQHNAAKQSTNSIEMQSLV